MKKICFHMSDEDWKTASSMIGDGNKYLTTTDFMNDAARQLIEKRQKEKLGSDKNENRNRRPKRKNSN